MPEVEDKEEASAIEKMQSSGVSRRKLMSMAGGSVALGAFLAACGGDDDNSSTSSSGSTGSNGSSSSPMGEDNSTAMFGEGDLGILNYALTLEYLETAFYADVIKSGLFKGSDLEAIKLFG